MIKDLTPGLNIVDFFMLRKKELRKKHQSDEYYVSVELTDSSGRIFGTVWRNAKSCFEEMHEGQPVKIKASVITFKEKLHLNIAKIRNVKESDGVDLESFLPTTDLDKNALQHEIEDLTSRISDEYLKQLLNTIFTDPIVAQQKCEK